MISVGLHYLTLDRTAPTLSGGESQRIRLASQVGAGLRGVIYVLDEPSIGLHPRDNGHLLATLQHLRDQGNTVIVVEHDEDTMWAGDLIVDFGPGPGIKGGEIAAIGTPQELLDNSNTLTAQYLRGEQRIDVPVERRFVGDRWLEIAGARHNNLKNIDVRIPIASFTCVTGVSGSGKSSLINDILYEALSRELMKAHGDPGEHKAIRAFVSENEEMEYPGPESLDTDFEEYSSQNFEPFPPESIRSRVSDVQVSVTSVIDKVIDIDQAPIGRNSKIQPCHLYEGIRSYPRTVCRTCRFKVERI